MQEAYYHDWEVANSVNASLSKKDVQIVQQCVAACSNLLQVDIDTTCALHLLHVNVIWALMEDAPQLVGELSELRVTHDMNIEDANW